VAEVDEAVGEQFLAEAEPSVAELKAGLRRAVLKLAIVPVFMGSAYKNKGVQLLLDGVADYLPAPTEKVNIALDRDAEEAEVVLSASDAKAPLVALAFKLEESRFGQLTYMRIYQGQLRKGDFFYNVDKRERQKVPRLVRMHANNMEDIEAAGAGEIVATFGVECATGHTFTADAKTNLGMTSMYVPDPVISYSVRPTDKNKLAAFGKALGRFTKEDPTFRSHVDAESQETIISGMGELHLDIYVERMKREYGVEVAVGEPRVNFRESINARCEFNYLHKKQSGGSGQFGRVIGYIEPLPPGEGTFEFVNGVVGNNIGPEFIPAVEKGFREAVEKGPQIGHPVVGLRVVLQDGQTHVVDSSEMAFRMAAVGAFREAFAGAKPSILEPVMSVEVSVPHEHQGVAIALLNKRKGQMTGSEAQDLTCVIQADVPLSQMFGFSTDIRSATQGKGEFAMEYKEHAPVGGDVKKELIKKFVERNAPAKK
jgi:elongation factor G